MHAISISPTKQSPRGQVQTCLKFRSRNQPVKVNVQNKTPCLMTIKKNSNKKHTHTLKKQRQISLHIVSNTTLQYTFQYFWETMHLSQTSEGKYFTNIHGFFISVFFFTNSNMNRFIKQYSPENEEKKQLFFFLSLKRLIYTHSLIRITLRRLSEVY